jgi:hypothetical protein
MKSLKQIGDEAAAEIRGARLGREFGFPQVSFQS